MRPALRPPRPGVIPVWQALAQPHHAQAAERIGIIGIARQRRLEGLRRRQQLVGVEPLEPPTEDVVRRRRPQAEARERRPQFGRGVVQSGGGWLPATPLKTAHKRGAAAATRAGSSC